MKKLLVVLLVFFNIGFAQAYDLPDMKLQDLEKHLGAEAGAMFSDEMAKHKITQVKLYKHILSFNYKGILHHFMFKGDKHKFLFFNGRSFSKTEIKNKQSARKAIENRFGLMSDAKRFSMFPALLGRGEASSDATFADSTVPGFEYADIEELHAEVQKQIEDDTPVVENNNFEDNDESQQMRNFHNQTAEWLASNPDAAKKYEMSLDAIKGGSAASIEMTTAFAAAVVAMEGLVANPNTPIGKVFFLGESSAVMPSHGFSL